MSTKDECLMHGPGGVFEETKTLSIKECHERTNGEHNFEWAQSEEWSEMYFRVCQDCGLRTL